MSDSDSKISVTGYSDAVNQSAEKAIAKALEAQAKTRGFLSVDWSDKQVRRGDQQFAVFRGVAYDVTPFKVDDESGAATYEPIVADDGRLIRQSPDEGRDGVLMHVHTTRRRDQEVDHHRATFISRPWIRTHELEQSNQQIAENIAKEAVAATQAAEIEAKEREKRGLDPRYISVSDYIEPMGGNASSRYYADIETAHEVAKKEFLNKDSMIYDRPLTVTDLRSVGGSVVEQDGKSYYRIEFSEEEFSDWDNLACYVGDDAEMAGKAWNEWTEFLRC